MNFKKLLTLTIASAILVGMPLQAATDKDTDKKAEQKDSTQTKKKDSYESLLQGAVSAKGDFVSFHKVKDKFYLEYPVKHFGREILIGNTVTAVSNPNMGNIGYKYGDPRHFVVDKVDSSLVFSIPSIVASLGSEDPGLKEAFEKNFINKVFKRLPIAAYNNDSTTVVVDFTKMIREMGVTPGFEGAKAGSSEDKETNSIGEMKAFDDNASVQIFQNVSIYQIVSIIKFKLGEISTCCTVSFMLLPEDKMAPRVQDSRVGVFYTANGSRQRYEVSAEEDGFKPYILSNRWRVEPTDIEAWQKGELVTVKKPIVWYVDNTFPAEWKAPIKAGVLRWNQAFEKIGLKDVMQVRDFPTAEEDPQFDPDNLKYSCIRYVPARTKNAMGPSWTDPITGEILNASVIVYNDIVTLINNWRLIQTAQVDERVRSQKMPKDVFDESMEYVIAHEIGHTLGLMHNMSGSASIPVDSLRSVSFTEKYGTTSSIMDYARFNYVAQPGDKGVKLTPPYLGVYDEYLIKWLYQPVVGAKDMWEEAAIASKIIDEKAGDPMFRYGRQQLRTNYDPSALTEDLGDDPIKAGDYGISNLKFILPNLNNWITNDEDTRLRNDLYTQLANQYLRYLNNVTMQIGGMYLTETKEGQGKPVVLVDKDRQRESLKWVMDQLRNIQWINNPELTSKFPLHMNYSNTISNIVAKNLLTTAPSNVILSSHIAEATGEDTYTLAEYYDDLYNEVFQSTIKNRKLSSEEKGIQRLIVSTYAKSVIALNNGVKSITLPSLDELIFTGQISEEMISLYGDQLREIEEEYGKGTVASSLVEDSFGEDRAPFIPAYNIANIDDAASYSQVMLTKINKLMKSKSKSGAKEDRAHYQYLLSLTDSALNK